MKCQWLNRKGALLLCLKSEWGHGDLKITDDNNLTTVQDSTGRGCVGVDVLPVRAEGKTSTVATWDFWKMLSAINLLQELIAAICVLQWEKQTSSSVMEDIDINRWCNAKRSTPLPDSVWRRMMSDDGEPLKTVSGCEKETGLGAVVVTMETGLGRFCFQGKTARLGSTIGWCFSLLTTCTSGQLPVWGYLSLFNELGFYRPSAFSLEV